MTESVFPRVRQMPATSTSRRLFLRMMGGLLAGSLFASWRAVSAFPATGAPATSPARTSALVAAPASALRYDSAAFIAHVNEQFILRDDAGNPMTLDLARVVQHEWRAMPPAGSGVAAPSGETFSVLFQAPAAQVLRQGTYELEHRAFGAFPLFIVPMAAEGGLQTYEATFSLLRD